MIRLCEEHFEGPFDIEAPGVQRGHPGVYVIVCECRDGVRRMVAIDFSQAIDRDLGDPENLRAWREPYEGRLVVYVWYAAKSSTGGIAKSLAQAIRERYVPWDCRTPNQCGKRYAPGGPK